jgi:hypothetical protein
MTQQMTWRCRECEAVVTTSSTDGPPASECPNCRTPKEAPGRNGGDDGKRPKAYDLRAESSFADTAGPEMDRLLARRVLGGAAAMPVPPYSSEDWAAMALAELVGRQSGWSFHLAFCGNAWMATFTEKGEAKDAVPDSPVASFVSATGRSRALAIARALLKVARCPRWMPLGDRFLAGPLTFVARAAQI